MRDFAKGLFLCDYTIKRFRSIFNNDSNGNNSITLYYVRIKNYNVYAESEQNECAQKARRQQCAV